ncbi:MAG: hypothetical protein LBM16_02120 [Clostridiales bacterium]|jgi:hypothetical protein|nr:hypothetical protein [Clostridiales bacterium]
MGKSDSKVPTQDSLKLDSKVPTQDSPALDSKVSIEDSLDKDEISQLYKAVSGFSSQSFELKKLCVTVEVSVCTLFFTVFIDNFDNTLFDNNLFGCLCKLSALLIPILFCIVDITTYYYQDKLRASIFKLENNIRKRHEIATKENKRFTTRSRVPYRLFRSILNASNIIYLGLIVIGSLLFFIF